MPDLASGGGAETTSGAICGGTNVRYQARGRLQGQRKLYTLTGRPTKSYRVAVMRMAAAFAEFDGYKRADVIMMADYYEPIQLCELVRR